MIVFLFFLGCSIARWLHISRYIPAFYITACLPPYPIAAPVAAVPAAAAAAAAVRSQLMSLALHLLIMFMFCIVFAHFLIFTFMYH